MTKKWLIGLAPAAALLMTGCLAQTPATETAPGDGPAAVESEPATEETPLHDEITEPPMDEEPSEEPSEASGPSVAAFDEKVIYPDGIEVEVTEIRTQPLSEYGYASEDAEEGDTVHVLTVRVRNGGETALEDQYTSCGMSFGADGEPAQTVSDEGITDASVATLLPGKAKSGDLGFIVPENATDDVVMECTVDFEHDSAIFSGSLD